MTATLTTSGAVLFKAGTNVNTTLSISGAWIETYINQAESFINCITRYNWTDKYSALNADVKLILDEAVSDLAAIYAIEYDMTAYNSRAEAELMMTVLYQRAIDCIEILKDQKTQTFMTGA
jgi:hypothetical protein